MSDYTTTRLIASIRRRAGAPTSTAQGTTDADLLLIATEELLGEVTSFIRGINENHLMALYEVALESGVAEYAIPQRAIGGSLKDAVFQRSDDTYGNLHWMDISDLPQKGNLTGEPRYFYFKDQRLIVHPAPQEAGMTLMLPYFRRCNRLVAPSAVAVVNTVVGSTINATTTLPSTFGSGDKYDLVQSQPPFESLAIDIVASSVGSSSIEFSGVTLPTRLEEGDYLCLAGEAPVPQIPEELHQFLAQAACVELLSGPFGDLEQLPAAKAKLDRLRDEVLPNLMKDRVSSEQQNVANPYYFRMVQDG